MIIWINMYLPLEVYFLWGILLQHPQTAECAYMCVCVCVRGACACAYLFFFNVCSCVCVCVCVCVSVSLCVCVCVFVCLCMSLHICPAQIQELAVLLPLMITNCCEQDRKSTRLHSSHT